MGIFGSNASIVVDFEFYLTIQTIESPVMSSSTDTLLYNGPQSKTPPPVVREQPSSADVLRSHSFHRRTGSGGAVIDTAGDLLAPSETLRHAISSSSLSDFRFACLQHYIFIYACSLHSVFTH